MRMGMVRCMIWRECGLGDWGWNAQQRVYDFVGLRERGVLAPGS
jgi:hypothetical protein